MSKIGKSLALLFAITLNTAHAGLEEEIKQQIQIEKTLATRLDEAKEEADKAYKQALDFYKDETRNRDEKIHNLEESSSAWNDFIEKTCLFESNESLGTRSEKTSILNCLIKKYKSKAEYYLHSF